MLNQGRELQELDGLSGSGKALSKTWLQETHINPFNPTASIFVPFFQMQNSHPKRQSADAAPTQDLQTSNHQRPQHTIE